MEIEAWSRMRSEPVRGFELDMLRALDRAYLDAARDPEPAAPKVSRGRSLSICSMRCLGVRT